MAKKIAPRKKSTAPQLTAATLPDLRGNGWLFLNDFRWQAVVIAAVGILFYINTYNNYYCLDDDIIMKQNMYVQKGISGIPEILGNDAYKSYYESMGVEQQLAGGRYRPLSVVTFAIEQSLFGECYGDRATEARDSLFAYQRAGINDLTMNKLINEKNYYDKKIDATNMAIAPTRHAFQVFWFVLSMIVLLWLLREHIFRGNTDIAFLSVLLFTIHPIHTEVIANVKSRDEIFSLLFICLTLIFFFRYDLNRRRKDLIWGSISFFLAFLSKEYALALVVLIPASIMLFHGRTFRQILYLFIPIFAVLAVYAYVHYAAVGGASGPQDLSKQDPLNDPYLPLRKKHEADILATKINRLDDYFWLCLIPYPLVSDYSYQHFPYVHLVNPEVLLSITIMLGMIVLTVRLWNKKHPMAFAALFYLGFFAMICNIFFDIGATMGERLIYHSSLGICMGIAWCIVKGIETFLPDAAESNSPKAIVVAIFLLISVPAFMETTKRNAEWKDDFTLFTADVKKHPNSALCNGNAGARYMDKGLKALGHDTIIGKDTLQHYGRDTVAVHHYADTAMIYLLKATTLHDKYVNGWLNLGLCYYYKDDFEKAGEAWGQAYQYFPSNTILLTYESMLTAQANNAAAKKDFKKAAFFLKCATLANPGDAKAWADYGGSSYMSMDFATAKFAFDRSNEEYGKQIDEQTKAGNQQKAAELKQQQNALRGGLGASMYDNMYTQAWKRDTMNADTTIILAKMLMGTPDFFPTSRRLLNHALDIRPNDANALKLLDSLGKLEQKLPMPVPTPSATPTGTPVPTSGKK